MPLEVHITDDRFGDGTRIYITRKFDGEPRQLYRPGAAWGGQWDDLDPNGVDVEPSIQLNSEISRALLDALTRHYHGAEDTRALRRDYDAERQRVDTQAQVIADVARTLAAGRIGATQ